MTETRLDFILIVCSVPVEKRLVTEMLLDFIHVEKGSGSIL